MGTRSSGYFENYESSCPWSRSFRYLVTKLTELCLPINSSVSIVTHRVCKHLMIMDTFRGIILQVTWSMEFAVSNSSFYHRCWVQRWCVVALHTRQIFLSAVSLPAVRHTELWTVQGYYVIAPVKTSGKLWKCNSVNCLQFNWPPSAYFFTFMSSVCSLQGNIPSMDSGYYYVPPDLILSHLYSLHIIYFFPMMLRINYYCLKISVFVTGKPKAYVRSSIDAVCGLYI